MIMTKKRRTGLIALLLSALLLAGCNESNGVSVIDADNYKGVIVSAAETTTSDHKQIIINDINTEDSLDTSESLTDPSESEQSEPVSDTSEPLETTTQSVTTPEVTEPLPVTASETTAPLVTTTEPVTATSNTKDASAPETVRTSPNLQSQTDSTKVPKPSSTPTDNTTPEEIEISLDDEYMGLDSFYASHYETLNYSEIKAIWITYIEIQSLLTGKTETEFRSSIGKAFENCKQFGINTIYVHLRPFGDAIYSSEYFPWSKYVTGSIGESPDFDPLDVMIQEAHDRKLSIHGYLNPLRTFSDKEIEQVSGNYAIGRWYRDSDKNGKYLVNVDGRWYLNPAYDETINLICNGVMEIVANYNVDGIIIDDYFYPTTAISFDSDAFMNSSYSTVYSFRIDNCSRLVKSMYNAVKNANSAALFSVSAAGNVENNKNYYYADVETWCSVKGYADIMTPQLYFGFENAALPFQTALETWNSMIGKSGVKLSPTLGVYKCGDTDGWAGSGADEWVNNNDIIARQIIASEEVSNYTGVALYSYNYIFSPSYLTETRKSEIEKIKVLLNFEG